MNFWPSRPHIRLKDFDISLALADANILTNFQDLLFKSFTHSTQNGICVKKKRNYLPSFSIRILKNENTY